MLPLDAAVVEVVVEGSSSSSPAHPDDYGPYPFNPLTAFQQLRPTELEVVREEQENARDPLAENSVSRPGHSDEKEVVFDSLVGTAEVLSVGIVHREPDPTYPPAQYGADGYDVGSALRGYNGDLDSIVGLRGSSYGRPPTAESQISSDTAGNYSHAGQSSDPFVLLPDEEGVYDQDQQSSPYIPGLRRLLSRYSSRSSLFGISRKSSRTSAYGMSRHSSRSSAFGTSPSSGPSRNSHSRNDPYLQPHFTTLSSPLGLWGFLRGPRHRAADIEGKYAAYGFPDPAELDGQASQHFELGPSTREELQHSPQRRRVVLRREPFRQLRPDKMILKSLCGPLLCSPQYFSLCRVYISQIEKKLAAAVHHSAVASPNPTKWPQPLAYLANYLSMVTRQLTCGASVKTFVLAHTDHFADMILDGSFDHALGANSTSDGEKVIPSEAMGCEPGNLPPRHQKIVYEWLLFSLEIWTMLDFSRSIGDRGNLPASQTFCDSVIEDLMKPHLPVPNTSVPGASGGMPTTIVPSELTASMLHDWKGIRFKWTDEIMDHLRLDSQEKVVQLYANVAFCHLHTLAKENSSLQKAGFTQQYQAMVEISETYRLLFGSDRQSQRYFRELESSNPTGGFFDIFMLPNGDCEPRFLYNVGSDFPLFGERLLVLKTLLRPNGIYGLWKDKRDSLQWYTFWAVVFLGCFGAIVAVLQLMLSAVQAWASVRALHA